MDDEELLLDPQMDFEEVKGLSKEIMQRLGVVRPRSIVSALISLLNFVLIQRHLQGAAKRMEGMTPSGLICLLRHAKKFHVGDEKALEAAAVV